MAASGAAVDTGHGRSIAFGTSSYSIRLLNWTLGGISREVIEVPHMGLTGPGTNKFGNLPKLASEIIDGGSLTFSVYQHTLMSSTNGQPPIKNATEAVTITFPLASGDVTAAKITNTGIVESVEIVAGGSNESMVANITVQFSGEVTVAPATTS